MAAAVRGVKGLVLAAGLGTRLRPLTLKWPKPLLPFAGTHALELALWRLAKAEVQDVAVNAHYLPDQIKAAVERAPFGQTLKIAIEPEILGTGGVYNPLRTWIGLDDLVVINGDVISTIDIAALLAHHRGTNAVATMALLPAVIPGESAVFYDEGGIRAIGKSGPATCRAGNFACAQVLTPAFLDLLPRSGVFDVISKGYVPALQRGLKISSLVHTGFWHDLRTPAFYAAALKDYLHLDVDAGENVGVPACLNAKDGRAVYVPPLGSVTKPWRGFGPAHVDEGASIAPTATIGPDVVIEAGATIGDGAVVRSCIVLPGAVIAPGSVVENAVVTADSTIQT